MIQRSLKSNLAKQIKLVIHEQHHFEPEGRLKNHTTYGALGYLIREEADVYFRKETPFFLDDTLTLSSPGGNDE